MAARRILVIEDDRDIAHLVALHLQNHTYEVVVAAGGRDGLAQADIQPFDLIVLDLMLPDIDGFEVCERLRAVSNLTPVLMLTSRDTEHDRVLGFELGADDYLTKPFSVRELVARVKALLRRVDVLRSMPPSHHASLVHSGGLTLDRERRAATLNGQTLALTGKEFDLLLQFARHPGRVFRRSQLLDLIWGYGHETYGHTVNTLINRLRAKIERDPTSPTYIVTVWGVGYTFHPPQPVTSP